MKMDFLLEEDFYKPVSEYFKKKGFEIRGELGHCDVFGIKDDKILVIELKKGLTIDLILQATKRQKIADEVYVCIPKPRIKFGNKRWRDIYYLLKRLELGLIFVSRNEKNILVDVILEPKVFDIKKSKSLNKKNREKLLKEFKGRSFDDNIGGSRGRKIMTAYKELALKISFHIKDNGPASALELSKNGFDKKTTYSILYNNYYKWFNKIGFGLYDISEEGILELEKYKEYFSSSKGYTKNKL
ncbi:MAG: DUF2161 family putative PD-(D/E)XK-type phosphodiesterase [Clostridiales bacterium]